RVDYQSPTQIQPTAHLRSATMPRAQRRVLAACNAGCRRPGHVDRPLSATDEFRFHPEASTDALPQLFVQRAAGRLADEDQRQRECPRAPRDSWPLKRPRDVIGVSREGVRARRPHAWPGCRLIVPALLWPPSVGVLISRGARLHCFPFVRRRETLRLLRSM